MPTHFISYLTSSFLLQGALLALEIAGLAMVIGLILGLGLALLRLSRSSVLSGIAWFYIWIMRGTPLLLQLVFIFDVLPAVGLTFGSFTTAVIGFSLNEAAFTAEIIRGGIVSVNRSQSIAATALGMPPLLTLRRIVLPQAMRAILPALSNQTISLIKGTSIASVIFVNELTFRAEQIVAQNFRFFEVFTAAGMIYLVMTSAVALGQLAAERRFDFMRVDRGGIRQRLLAMAGRGKPPAPSHAARPEPARERLPTLIASICHDLVSADTEPCVVCRNVQKSYGEQEVLKSVDMTVRSGEVVVIMGPSGSGKSTLLRLINHLEPLDWGEITVHGRHVGYEKIPGRRPAPHPQPCTGSRQGADRHGVPALQPVRSPQRAGQCRRGTGDGAWAVARLRTPRRHAACSLQLVSLGTPTTIRTSCQAGNNSVWRSPGRLRFRRG